MSMYRGGQQRAKQKVWPGHDAATIRDLKRAQGVEQEEPQAEAPKRVDHAKLVEHIAMPDWEKRMLPLFLFRGSQPYRIRTLQNVAYGMFLAEAESFGEGIKLFPKEGVGHLCGLHASVQHTGLRGIFGRMRGCKKFTDSIGKAFTEYVEWIHPYPCVYIPVPLHSTPHDRHRHAWWRLDAPYAQRIYLPRPAMPSELAYPYVRGDPRPEHDLLMKVHAMIPSRITGDLRADLCQDMFVAVLSGDIQIEQIPESIKAYASKAREIAPNRWRDVSLDEITSDPMRIAKFHREKFTPDFTLDLCEAIHYHEEDSGIPAAHWNENGVIVHREINVSAQDEDDRAKSCTGKQQFATQAEADSVCHLAEHRRRSYECQFCRRWHVGRFGPWQQEQLWRSHEETGKSEHRMGAFASPKQDVRRQRPKRNWIRGDTA